jgi:ribosomal protein L11 methyltransferase
MDYLEIKITCDETYKDIIIAELDGAGFESFWETDVGVNAYISKADYDEELLKAILQRYKSAKFETENVKEKNWNEEWEKNYDPIVVEDQVFVGASFHQAHKNFPYNILINPRMSFGTGHHETTYLMLSQMLEIDHHDKKVLDVGCGTGILAIMAYQRGASYVVAVDNNDWAVENCEDNIIQNNAQIKLYQGTIEDIPGEKFDLILANINRNVLLQEAIHYTSYLHENGTLLLSGFYKHDISDITEKLHQAGWEMTSFKEKNNWVAIKLKLL